MTTYTETAHISADPRRLPVTFGNLLGRGVRTPDHDANHPGAEQRIKPRFDAPYLSVRMRARGLLGWEKESEVVECLDINRYGTALRTRRHIKPGSFIRLDFRGDYITQSDVCARVKSQVMEGDGAYRISVQFNYCIDRSHYSRSIDNALSQIEAFCRRQTAHYQS